MLRRRKASLYFLDRRVGKSTLQLEFSEVRIVENFVGMKELYDVSLRLCRPLEIDGKRYEMNESVLTFKTAEIAQINENKKVVNASGGYNDNVLMFWEIDKEMRFAISHGVLSPTSWALLSNSKLKRPNVKSIMNKEVVEVYEDDNYCYATLKFCPNARSEIIGAQPNPDFEELPMGRREELMLKPLPPSKTKWIFIYDEETGLPIKEFTIYGNKVFFKKPCRRIMVDYTFTYEDKIKVIEVGKRLQNCFMRLDAKMTVKDEISGQESTAILEMPKIQLSSSLSMRLGKNYDSSTVSDFYFIGYPDENERREDRSVAKITFLDKELTGDYI